MIVSSSLEEVKSRRQEARKFKESALVSVSLNLKTSLKI